MVLLLWNWSLSWEVDVRCRIRVSPDAPVPCIGLPISTVLTWDADGIDGLMELMEWMMEQTEWLLDFVIFFEWQRMNTKWF